MNHAERYEFLVNKMAAIRWRGSDLDASYHAALFLMASHPALFQKMDRYLCPEGIDFTKMMRKEEFEYDWMKITADAARNLFSWNSKCAATPFRGCLPRRFGRSLRPASSPMGTTWYLSGKMTKEKRCLKLTTAPVNGGRRSICKWSR